MDLAIVLWWPVSIVFVNSIFLQATPIEYNNHTYAWTRCSLLIFFNSGLNHYVMDYPYCNNYFDIWFSGSTRVWHQKWFYKEVLILSNYLYISSSLVPKLDIELVTTALSCPIYIIITDTLLQLDIVINI